MNAAAERLEFAPPATPGLLRALLLALLAHGLLVAALTWGVQWRREARQLSAEAELWAAIPQEAAPPAPPPEPPPAQAAPEPVPPPPAPPPEVEPPKVDIALEREKQRLQMQKQKQLELERQQEKLKQEKLRQEQLKADKLKAEKLKQAQADKAKAAQDKKKAEQDAKRVEALRQQNLQRLAGMAGASGNANANATGTALKSAGPSASYAGRIRARIKPNIVFTEELPGNPTTEVEVRTAPDGTIVGRKVTKTSGVKEWDEAVLKAIDKTQILPRDVDGSMPSSLLLVFRPKD